MANSSSADDSNNSYNSDNDTTANNNNNHYNSDSDAKGSGSDSEDDKPLASRMNRSDSDNDNDNNNGNGYASESQSQDMSSQSIKRERSDSEDNSDDEPLSQKLAKQVKKERKSDSEDDYEPTPKKTKTNAKVKVKKETKSSKRKNDSDYDSEYDSEEDYKESKKSKKKKSYSDDDDDDYDEPKKKKAKVKKEKTPKKSDSKTKSKVKKEVNSSPEKSPKKKAKKEEDEEHIWKWWEEDKPGEGIKWKTLQHKGPVFPPPYEPLPSSVKFYYNKHPMKLSPGAEEVAGFYARMLEHDYVTKTAFNKNFFKDWRKTMTKEEQEKIKELDKCNFGEIAEYYKDQSEKRKAMSKEEKKKIKEENDKLIEEYGFCMVDGHKQKIGNFKIEPPGLFRGRGEHPKMGMLKKRVKPENVIINIGKKAQVPAPPAGHKWKEVTHDNTVTWLASWKENVLGTVKYIMLNPSSKLKSMKDWQKYEKARELKKYVDKIREDYRADFKAREMMKRQRAVALYFIDKLALRAGNEKEEGETADTVGCCSLRVEHIQLHEEKDGKEYVVDFDFPGKDSIRYENSVSVEKRVFKNLKHFMENKRGDDDLFDRIDTSELNKYLSSLMEGLTAKVFRTYNASQVLQNQLNELTKEGMSPPEKLLAYNRANRKVAVLCNHQRAVPKTFDKQMENLEAKIKDKKKQVKEAKKAYKEGKNTSNKDKLKKRMNTLEDQLKKLEVQRTDKEENKQIALGTSKLNYLDPRITVAWCKKWDVAIEKVYNKTQRDKFRWAIEMIMASDEEYQF